MRDPSSAEGTSMGPLAEAAEHRFSPDWDPLVVTPDATVPLPVEGASYSSAEPTKVCGPFYDLTYCS